MYNKSPQHTFLKIPHGRALLGTYYVSADLQKAIMLPRMTEVKMCAFARRIIAFNETDAELGKAKSNVAVMWHKFVCVRSASDICSAFLEFFDFEGQR